MARKNIEVECQRREDSFVVTIWIDGHRELEVALGRRADLENVFSNEAREILEDGVVKALIDAFRQQYPDAEITPRSTAECSQVLA